MSVHFGTDTYGKVKTVGGTPIVTVFAMLNSLPLRPLQSYYFIGLGEGQEFHVPFVGGMSQASVVGVPLAKIDLASVTIAYARGMFGLLAVIGSIVIVPFVSNWRGEPLDDVGGIIVLALLSSLAVGIVGGVLTYCWPLTSRRERNIRLACGEFLGVCVDPALAVLPYAADALRTATTMASAMQPTSTHAENRYTCVAELVAVRAKIALGEDRQPLEARTNELLEIWQWTSEVLTPAHRWPAALLPHQIAVATPAVMR